VSYKTKNVSDRLTERDQMLEGADYRYMGYGCIVEVYSLVLELRVSE